MGRYGFLDDVVWDGNTDSTGKQRKYQLRAEHFINSMAIKDLITQNASEGDLSVVQQREMAALSVAYRSPEHKEAIAAFLEKRDPDFKKARQGG